MTQFSFLSREWPNLLDAATGAESAVYRDPRTACFYARRALEQAVAWLYRYDKSLRLPYQNQLNALIHEPSFRTVVGPAIFAKARLIKDLGNEAVHSAKVIRQIDALNATRELFHICFWLARTYGRGTKPADGLAFNIDLLPKAQLVPQQTLEQLRKLSEELATKDQRLSELLSDKATNDDELARLREEVARAKATNAATPDAHDYSEEATRDAFVDILLRETGWMLDQPRDIEFEVDGMPNVGSKGFVDYVLWGDDGKPLGLVEAKRTRRDARVGRQQAKLYADCLERQFGQRPVIFYTNGYEHWLWDDTNHPPRSMQGFYKKAELDLLVQRRKTRRPLASVEIDSGIVGRHYQTRAIRRIGESFEKDAQRKALVVMATGAGKTRTVIALVDLLMRANWAKRVLFLADRVALVSQAVKAFKKHLPDAAPVNLVTEKGAEGRVYVSTYPTMMNLIDDAEGGQRRFGVGHFDLVIIDEAHRSVYQKYGAIFDYFDAYLVGLTATPQDEIDRNTYRLFDLEPGVPTDAYPLDEAVADGFLVPLRAVSVPLKFQRQGIRYDDLSEEEKEAWDALEWNEDGVVPDRVEAAAVNKWLFNADTVDRVLEHLMTHGQTVAGGDRLGKTIIFAKSNDHAEFIAQRFDANYPHLKGAFARVITFKTEYAQSLIDDFSIKDKAPHIAISVDMLDTGVDVPEVVNLVFFKLVRSKTKFWQMIGRGTRLCPDLFAPGQDKSFFYLFDFCQNLEFFNQNPEMAEGSLAEPLGTRLFKMRLALIESLDKRKDDPPKGLADPAVPFGGSFSEPDVRRDTADLLYRQVVAMNLDNFVVRPRRKLIEKYGKAEAWNALGPAELAELAEEVARLPTELTDEDEDAKRFDLLMLRLQLCVLNADPGFDRLKEQVRAIASALEGQANIPAIRDQMVLIEALISDEWWQDVTVPMLEVARRRIRALVKLIEKGKKKVVYTDFEDEIGQGAEVVLGAVGTGMDFERYKAKVRQFLNEHLDNIAIQKVRRNLPLTAQDIATLEEVLVKSGIGADAHVAQAKATKDGLGMFIRSLVGLEREAAMAALGEFVNDKSPDQIEFVTMIVDHLTERGVMDPAALYASPFVDISPRGPEGVFPEAKVIQLVSALEEIRRRAAAA